MHPWKGIRCLLLSSSQQLYFQCFLCQSSLDLISEALWDGETPGILLCHGTKYHTPSLVQSSHSRLSRKVPFWSLWSMLSRIQLHRTATIIKWAPSSCSHQIQLSKLTKKKKRKRHDNDCCQVTNIADRSQCNKKLIKNISLCGFFFFFVKLPH